MVCVAGIVVKVVVGPNTNKGHAWTGNLRILGYRTGWGIFGGGEATPGLDNRGFPVRVCRLGKNHDAS